MAQYTKHHFSKREWHCDDSGLRRQVIQKYFTGNVLPLLSQNASKPETLL